MTCHVEIVGQGKPLVMLHGWGMHSGVWQPLVKKLSQHYMLYLIDLPGMGNSRPIDPCHVHSVAEEVAEVIPGVSDILGWSMGGLIAQQIALNQPDRIRRLVLVGSSPRFINQDGWELGISTRDFQDFADKINNDYQQTILQFLTLQCMKAKNARETVKILRETLALKPAPTQATLERTLNILLQTDLRESVPNIHKPTLLIHGDRDTLAPVQAAHWMMKQLPKGFLRVMSGAAHAPFLSHSEQFVEALEQFLEPNT